MTGGLLRRGHTEERRPCNDGSRDWSDAATTQKNTKACQQPPAARNSKEGFVPSAVRESTALETLGTACRLLHCRNLRE